MKYCSVCKTEYPDSKITCDRDRNLLVASREIEYPRGTIVSKTYVIEDRLGEGGMGIVYLARHIESGKRRALKFLSPRISLNPKALERFRQEASIEIIHPNVVRTYDSMKAEDGSSFMPMDYVEGSELCKVIRDITKSKGFMPVPRAIALARGIARGLGEAHRLGILHRDLKPSNIMIADCGGEKETPKVLDFGIAAAEGSIANISRTRGTMLTPEYAAPEQWEGWGAREMDGRVDLYALGGVLYEMLTGRICFESKSETGWMYQHLQAERIAPSRLRPELANWPGLDTLVLSLLAKDREKRPASAAAVIERLDKLERRPPIIPQKQGGTKPEGRGDTRPEGHSSGGGPEVNQAGLFRGLFPPESSKILLWIAPVVALLVIGIAWAIWHKTQTVSATAKLVVSCTRSCTWTVDGDSQGALAAGGTAEASLTASTHLITATPDDPALKAESRSVTALSGQSVREDFVFGTTSPPPPSAKLVVTCNRNCTWTLDGSSRGSLVSGGRGEATLTASRHLVTATPDDPALKAESQSVNAVPGRTIREDFVFGAEQRPTAHPEIDALIESAYSKHLDDDLIGAYTAYSNAENLSMKSDKYRLQEAEKGKNDVLADCRDRKISCFVKP